MTLYKKSRAAHGVDDRWASAALVGAASAEKLLSRRRATMSAAEVNVSLSWMCWWLKWELEESYEFGLFLCLCCTLRQELQAS